MSRNRMKLPVWILCALSVALWAPPAAGQGGDPEQKITKVKESLQTSMAALHGYEWIETVTVKVDGEQKAQHQSQCYYGADGTLEKIPMGDQEEEGGHHRGLRGHIAKNKKHDMEEYVHHALELVKQYIPPDPAKMKAVKDAGKQRILMLDSGATLVAEFPEYLKPGDVFAINIDPKTDHITAIHVSSYLEDDTDDTIDLLVSFEAFQDGTLYPAKVDLKGESEDIEIVIENHGYRKAGA